MKKTQVIHEMGAHRGTCNFRKERGDICSANVVHVYIFIYQVLLRKSNTPVITVANALNEMGGGGVYWYHIIHGEIVHVLAVGRVEQ